MRRRRSAARLGLMAVSAANGTGRSTADDHTTEGGSRMSRVIQEQRKTLHLIFLAASLTLLLPARPGPEART